MGGIHSKAMYELEIVHKEKKRKFSICNIHHIVVFKCKFVFLFIQFPQLAFFITHTDHLVLQILSCQPQMGFLSMRPFNSPSNITHWSHGTHEWGLHRLSDKVYMNMGPNLKCKTHLKHKMQPQTWDPTRNLKNVEHGTHKCHWLGMQERQGQLQYELRYVWLKTLYHWGYWMQEHSNNLALLPYHLFLSLLLHHTTSPSLHELSHHCHKPFLTATLSWWQSLDRVPLTVLTLNLPSLTAVLPFWPPCLPFFITALLSAAVFPSFSLCDTVPFSFGYHFHHPRFLPQNLWQCLGNLLVIL